MIFWILAICALLVGAFIVFTGFRGKQSASEDSGFFYKNNLPILPRYKRKISANIDESLQDKITIETLDETSVQTAPKSSPLQAVVRHLDDSDLDNNNLDIHNTAYPQNTSVYDQDALSNLASVASLQANKKPAQEYSTDNISPTHNLNDTKHTPYTDTPSNNESQATQTQTTSHTAYTASDLISDNSHDLISDTAHAQVHSVNHATPTRQNARNDNYISTQDSFNVVVDSAFDGETPIVDKHLEHQENQLVQGYANALQDNDALINHEQTLTVRVSPKDVFDSFSGKKILGFAKTYAMKYGIMDMFHRYENIDGTGQLWFSMLGVTHEGVVPFDLNEMPANTYRGIALFVALPNKASLKGFDSMIEVAKAIAESIDGHLHDDNGYLIEDKDLVILRTIAEQNIG